MKKLYILLMLLLLWACADGLDYDLSTPDRALESMFEFIERVDRAYMADTSHTYRDKREIEHFFHTDILKAMRDDEHEAIYDTRSWDFYHEHGGMIINKVDIQSETRAEVIVETPHWFDSMALQDGDWVFEKLAMHVHVFELTRNERDDWVVRTWYKMCYTCGGSGISELYVKYDFGDKECSICDGRGRTRWIRELNKD